jgi:uncharacterized protein (TIGR00730 family)
LKRLAVYCGSATPADPRYIEAGARIVGRELAARNRAGLWRRAAGPDGRRGRCALEAGGEVIGVIPEALVGTEVAHRGCTELHVVPGMHERKRMFTDLSDGFITMPGGVGTMDELWEAISWAQLGYHEKPVGLLNIAGFYDQLVAFNRHMVDVGFIRPQHAGIMIIDESLDGLLEKMACYEPHKSIFQMKAEDL